MAIGPQERQILREKTAQLYAPRDKSECLAGMELALRGFTLARLRLDDGRIDWDAYVVLKGHYNATLQGIVDSLEQRKGVDAATCILWKKYHGPLWMDMTEPASITTMVQAISESTLPKIVEKNKMLGVLIKLIDSYKAVGSDVKKQNAMKYSIEANTESMIRNNLKAEAYAIRGIKGFDSPQNYDWMQIYAQNWKPTVKEPVKPNMQAWEEALGIPNDTPGAPVVKRKGLQKCTPASVDPMTSIPVAEDFGEFPMEDEPMTHPPAAKATKPKGLQKCTPASSDPMSSIPISTLSYDIGDNDFGM